MGVHANCEVLFVPFLEVQDDGEAIPLGLKNQQIFASELDTWKNGIVTERSVLVPVDEALDSHTSQMWSDQVTLDLEEMGLGLAQVFFVILV